MSPRRPQKTWRCPGIQVETTGRFTLVPRSQAGYVAPEVVEDDLEAEWNEVKARGPRRGACGRRDCEDE